MPVEHPGHFLYSKDETFLVSARRKPWLALPSARRPQAQRPAPVAAPAPTPPVRRRLRCRLCDRPGAFVLSICQPCWIGER